MAFLLVARPSIPRPRAHCAKDGWRTVASFHDAEWNPFEIVELRYDFDGGAEGFFAQIQRRVAAGAIAGERGAGCIA